MNDDFVESVTAEIRRWCGVEVPNETARWMAADLVKLIADFEAVRDRARFEDEPADFGEALLACKEPT
ncbi:MAG: hypothetical protein J0H09_05750 [Burkholderiales bacterium]|nr:hypothetical protein [Burkholderiales bacterium]